MKKYFLLFAFAGLFSSQCLAQDDMYFVPGKTKVKEVPREAPTYYVGSTRDIDEYNRRGRFYSSYQPVGADSVASDVISFQPGCGIAPDSCYVDTLFTCGGDGAWDSDDFACTRRMSRWDGYYDPWFYGYWGPRCYGYYDPWYDPWYYGSYYGWYGGWYSPWHYGYYGWGWPYYGHGWYGGWAWNQPYWGGGYVHHDGGNPRGFTGNRTWSYGGRGDMAGRFATGRYGAYAGRGTSAGRTSTYTPRSNANRSFGRTNTTNRAVTNQSRTFSNNRSNSNFGTSTRSAGSFGGASGGSFGGARSGGGFSGGGFGGGHAGGGGGHFGGGRR